MKKVLFVSHEKFRNGSTNSMVTLIKTLVKDYKYEVEVLLPSFGPATKLLQDNGIPYKVFYYFDDKRTINKKKIFREFIKESVNYLAVWRLILYLKKAKFDYVISNSSAVDIGARVSIKTNVKHIYYIREFMEEDFSFEYRNKKRMKKMLEFSNKTIFISHAVADKFVKLYKIENYRVIYNGIDPENYFIKNNKILERKELRLIQIGLLSDGKGTKSSVEFIDKLRKKIECHLTLVGNGSETYIQELYDYIEKKQLNENVTIVSYTNDIKSLFREEDILLINSQSEGFGRVTVEGMLGGLLAVGKNTGGTKEIITNGKTGILFDKCDDFLCSMYEINNNRQIYREIALKGQMYALKKFNPEKNAKDVEAYLREN
ncbi:MAG: glycosyltransferase family 4 protein [Clostridia bacterium]|nr:glycosyltransferase family 4 protein [Clostridia bacterium]